MPDYIKSSASFSWFQNLDGTRFGLFGVDENIKSNKGSAGAFLGIGTDTSKDVKVVLDFKGTYNYDKDGIINQNLRIRNSIGFKGAATDIRYSPLSISAPITEKTSFYVNPHYNGSINYKTDKWTNSAGVFAGFTHKISQNSTISLEAQRYNLQDIKDNSAKNWGINAIINWNL